MSGRAAQLDRFELFINGMRVDHANAGGVFQLDTTEIADGYSELRIVAIEAGPIETQGETVVPILVDNHGRGIAATASAAKLMAGAPLTISIKAPKTASTAIYLQSQLLGTISGASGKLSVDSAKLGLGLLVFRAVGKSTDTPPVRVLSRPVYVEIESRGK